MTFTQTKPDSPAHHYGERDRKERAKPQTVWAVLVDYADSDGLILDSLYETEALANAEAERLRDKYEAAGHRVFERLPVLEQDFGNWTRSVEVESHKVKRA